MAVSRRLTNEQRRILRFLMLDGAYIRAQDIGTSYELYVPGKSFCPTVYYTTVKKLNTMELISGGVRSYRNQQQSGYFLSCTPEQFAAAVKRNPPIKNPTPAKPYAIGWFRDPFYSDGVVKVSRVFDRSWFVTPYAHHGDRQPNGAGQLLTLQRWKRLIPISTPTL